MATKQYRLYLDESGDHHYGNSESMARYLCLTGIVVEKDAYTNIICPRIEQIRSLFYDDVDQKPPLHLSDIRNYKGVFMGLRDANAEARFNNLFLELLARSRYTVIAIVFDKKKHQEKAKPLNFNTPTMKLFMPCWGSIMTF